MMMFVSNKIMSDPFLSQDAFVKSWITNPFKQLNLGYTLTSFFYIAAVFVGLLLIVILCAILPFNEGYKSGSTSKRTIVILGWFGFGITLLGIWLTISNFYGVTNKIKRNIREYRNCSLFLPENAENAVKILISESIGDQKISEIIELRKDLAAAGAENLQQAVSLRAASNEYLRQDASRSVISMPNLMQQLNATGAVQAQPTALATVSGIRNLTRIGGPSQNIQLVPSATASTGGPANANLPTSGVPAVPT